MNRHDTYSRGFENIATVSPGKRQRYFLAFSYYDIIGILLYIIKNQSFGEKNKF